MMNIHTNTFSSSEDAFRFNEAIYWNNQGKSLNDSKNFLEAIKSFKKALEIKLEIFGWHSITTCVSLSGIADSYYYSNQLETAYSIASRMLEIAQDLKSEEQCRIAKLIIHDIIAAAGSKVDGLKQVEKFNGFHDSGSHVIKEIKKGGMVHSRSPNKKML